MNDIQTNEPKIDIAACVFVNMSSNSSVRLGKPKEQPYYYLNIIGAQTNDLALVHNGDNFALCKIVRLIDKSESLILNKVVKPLLTVVHYDQELLNTASDKLKEFREITTDARVMQQIDIDMGKVIPGVQPNFALPATFPQYTVSPREYAAMSLSQRRRYEAELRLREAAEAEDSRRAQEAREAADKASDALD